MPAPLPAKTAIRIAVIRFWPLCIVGCGSIFLNIGPRAVCEGAAESRRVEVERRVGGSVHFVQVAPGVAVRTFLGFWTIQPLWKSYEILKYNWFSSLIYVILSENSAMAVLGRSSSRACSSTRLVTSVGDLGDGCEQEVLVPRLQQQHATQHARARRLRKRTRAHVVHEHAEKQHDLY